MRHIRVRFPGLAGAGGLAQTASSPRIVETPTPFQTDEAKVAKDLSGIACLPAGSAPRTCVLVDDEGRSVQMATLTDGKLVAGDRIALFGDGPPTTVVGREPQGLRCSAGPDGFKDLDGEGVAYAAPFFYVAGSHGCSRRANKFRAGAFVTARFRVDGQGKLVALSGAPLSGQPGPDAVATTFRLSEALQKARGLEAFFGRDLGAATAGLNVEGIAVVGSTFYAGLRAPTLSNNAAAIVSVDADALFAPGDAPLVGEVGLLPVPVGGPDAGIRDLAALSDGRLLALVGPAQDQDSPYRLVLVDPRKPADARELKTFDAVAGEKGVAKAEGLLVVSEGPQSARVIILFDGLASGGPREYEVALR